MLLIFVPVKSEKIPFLHQTTESWVNSFLPNNFIVLVKTVLIIYNYFSAIDYLFEGGEMTPNIT